MTGHFAGDEESLKDEIHKMAAMDGTCVFLMGYTRLAEIVRELQNGGAAVETPVAVIHGTSDGSSRAAYGTLLTIEKEVQEKQIPMPAGRRYRPFTGVRKRKKFRTFRKNEVLKKISYISY